jgi:hypothetical protein
MEGLPMLALGIGEEPADDAVVQVEDLVDDRGLGVQRMATTVAYRRISSRSRRCCALICAPSRASWLRRL